MKKLLPILAVLLLFSADLACRTLSGEGGEPATAIVESLAEPSSTMVI